MSLWDFMSRLLPLTSHNYTIIFRLFHKPRDDPELRSNPWQPAALPSCGQYIRKNNDHLWNAKDYLSNAKIYLFYFK